MHKRAVALWTGGKDSAFALYEARKKGFEVVCLVTFVPEDDRGFSAHPQAKIREQAHHLGLPLRFVKIKEPYLDSYVAEFRNLKRALDISYVITGDIDEVQGYPNWVEQCCLHSQLSVELPLWKRSREELMAAMLQCDFNIEISWINHPGIPSEWKGRTIDLDLLSKMRILFSKNGIDLCGENGEYHTMVYWA